MSSIIIPIIIVSAIGLLAGIGLSVASAVFAVPTDERAEAVLEILPGANCGACGYSGCAGYAKALADGTAKNGQCAPGGQACAEKISELLGIGGTSVEQKVAVVRCVGTLDNTTNKMDYDGLASCAAAMQHFGGVSSCRYGCMGIGDCAAVCDFNAISVCNGVAHIDPTLCRGCGKCMAACPKKLIELVPFKDAKIVRCRNMDKGGATRKICKSGCIGCMQCQRNCPAGAVKVENSVAVVDVEKCIGCGLCSEVCPSKCITDIIKK
ncbi:MAG: RnfABCDGE type electron transport complex subunit B [Clostridia bacterium]|nr:RnfABCDGE type electron transport complex subunit B [Clostridia bacterium]